MGDIQGSPGPGPLPTRIKIPAFSLLLPVSALQSGLGGTVGSDLWPQMSHSVSCGLSRVRPALFCGIIPF